MNRLFLTAILACGCIELISSNQSIPITGNLAFAESSQPILQTPSNSHLLHPTLAAAEEGSDKKFDDATGARIPDKFLLKDSKEATSLEIDNEEALARPSPQPIIDRIMNDPIPRDSKNTSSAVEEEKKPSEAAVKRIDWDPELLLTRSKNTTSSVLERKEDQSKVEDDSEDSTDSNFNFG